MRYFQHAESERLDLNFLRNRRIDAWQFCHLDVVRGLFILGATSLVATGILTRPHKGRLDDTDRCPGLSDSTLPIFPVYREGGFVPPHHPGLPVVCRYTGVVHFSCSRSPSCGCTTPTHAAAYNTTHQAGCCGQQPTLAYTPLPCA